MAKHVDRIEADNVGAAFPAHTDKIAQVGKVADPPVAAAAERIKLHAVAPQAHFVPAFRLPAFFRRYHKVALFEGVSLDDVADVQFGVVITDRQIGGNLNFQPAVRFFADRPPFRQGNDDKGNLRLFACLPADDGKAEIAFDFVFGDHDVKNLAASGNNVNGFQRRLPAAVVQSAERAGDFFAAAGLISQNAGKKTHRFVAHLVAGGFQPAIGISGGNAQAVGQFAQLFIHDVFPLFFNFKQQNAPRRHRNRASGSDFFPADELLRSVQQQIPFHPSAQQRQLPFRFRRAGIVNA